MEASRPSIIQHPPSNCLVTGNFNFNLNFKPSLRPNMRIKTAPFFLILSGYLDGTPSLGPAGPDNHQYLCADTKARLDHFHNFGLLLPPSSKAMGSLAAIERC